MKRVIRSSVIIFMTLVLSGCICCSGPEPQAYVSISPVYKYVDGHLYVLKYSDLGNQKQKLPYLPATLYVFDDTKKIWLRLATITHPGGFSSTSYRYVGTAKINVLLDDFNLTRVQAIYERVAVLGNHGHEKSMIPTTANQMIPLTSEQRFQVREATAVTPEKFVIFNNNKVYLGERGNPQIISTTVLPTANEISAATGIGIAKPTLTYHVLRSGQLSWDGEYIIGVCDGFVAATVSSAGQPCHDYHFFHVVKKQNNWHIEKINVLSEDFEKPILSPIRFVYNYRAIDGKVTLCTSARNSALCFVKRVGQVKLEKLFGEIYSDGYEHFGTFDEHGNMHVFYNKPDEAASFNYDYFHYAYYTKDNPTVPLYQQKIPWYKK